MSYREAYKEWLSSPALSADEKADGHQPVGGDTTAAEHHLTAGTAHGPEQAAQQGHAVALDQERVIGLSHKMPSFIH